MPRMHNVVTPVSPNRCELEDSLEMLARRISAKINNGDIGSVVRLVCSSDTIAPQSPETLERLQAKRPPAPDDCSVPVFENDTSEVLDSISLPSPAVIRWATKSFPPSSAGGITALRPQHLKELTI